MRWELGTLVFGLPAQGRAHGISLESASVSLPG